jgi:hypothetical protein
MWCEGESDQFVWSAIQPKWWRCLRKCVFVLQISTHQHVSGVANGHFTLAVLWDNAGIAVYFFPRQNIPSDITAQAPVPDNWGTPSAFWPASSCNPFQFFQNHGAIFDTTLCGDWAGGVWTATGIPGQDQSCAQRTGVATCQQFVQQNGAALSEACASSFFFPLCILCLILIGTDWEVKGLQIYQSK